MVGVLGEDALYEFIGGRPPSLAELRDRYCRYLAGSKRPGERWLNWIVRTAHDGVAIGTVQATVSAIFGEPPVAELSWVIGATWQGRGFACEAAGSLVDWLHAKGIDDMRAHINSCHYSSAAVARRVGLQPTTSEREDEILWRSPVAGQLVGEARPARDRPTVGPRRRPKRGRGVSGTVTAVTIALSAVVLSACGSPAAVPGTTSTSTTSVPTSTSTTSTSTTTSTTTTTTMSTTTTVPATSTSTTTTAACPSGADLATWSLPRLAEETVVIPVDEGAVSSIAQQVAAGAGGIILFGSSAPSDLGAALSSLEAPAPGGIVPFVMTDEEGGIVQRMANLVGSIPSAREMGATLTPAQIRRLATTVAVRMRAEGVTMDLAPVLDVDGGQGPNNQDPDGTRSFSADEKIASADGIAFAQGLEAGGVVPVIKHFPGLGGATGNTDVMSASTPPWATLQKVGLVPFENAVEVQVPAVMIANASVPGLTTVPASISLEVITKLLRDQLGFNGLVITDSLSAISLSAIGYSVPAATVAALEAGADMVLFNAASSAVAALTNQIVSAVVSAVASGKLARSRLEDAVAHILTVKHVEVCPSS